MAASRPFNTPIHSNTVGSLVRYSLMPHCDPLLWERMRGFGIYVWATQGTVAWEGILRTHELSQVCEVFVELNACGVA